MENQRQSQRKCLRVKAVLVMAGEPPMFVRTADINAHGVSLLMPSPVNKGQQGQIAFNIYFDGKSHAITSTAIVAYCIFSGDEFKVGFVFAGMEPSSIASISHFLR